jgi:von Willebrand factor type A domain
VANGGGYLWVADLRLHKVFRYDAAFACVAIGGYGTEDGKLSMPSGVVFDTTTGTLYVSEAQGNRISTFDTNGQSRGTIPLPIGRPHELHKVTLDTASGRLFVADAAADAVHVFDLASAPPLVSLDSDVLDFGLVGVEYSVRRSVAIRNDGSVPVTITALDVWGPGFSVDDNAAAAPFTLGSGATRDTIIRWTAPATGTAMGLLRAASDTPSLSPLFAQLRGEGIAVEPMSLALVLDRSGSMTLPSGTSMSKLDRLHDACALLIDILSHSGRDELALISFSTTASVDAARAALAPAATIAMKAIATGLTPGGMTSIGGGLDLGFGQLATSSLNRRNVIVLSDGMENTPPMIADVPVPAGTSVFSVGLGLPQFVDAGKLATLATANGGYFQVTDGNDDLLPKFFVQIFSDLTGRQIAVDPSIALQQGEAQQVPLYLTGGDVEVIVTLTWQRLGCDFELALVSPSGRIVDQAQFAWVVSGQRYLAVRMSFRGSDWEEPGRWTVLIRALRTPSSPELAILNVLVSSDYHLDWRFQVLDPEKEQTSPPADVAPDLGPSLFPPIPRFPAPLGQMRRSVPLRIEVVSLSSTNDFTIVTGFVDIQAPGKSLAALRKQFTGIDIDHLEPVPHWPEKLDRPTPKRQKFRVDRRQNIAATEVVLDGLDGVYQCSIQISAETRDGYLFQRERYFSVLAH